MSTYNKLKELQGFIKKSTGLDCRLGRVAPASRELPLFIIAPIVDDEVDESPRDEFFKSVDFNVQIQLIARDDETALGKALNGYDLFMKDINSFNYGQGNALSDSVTKEYNDEGEFIITWTYALKITLQKTGA